MSAVKSALPEKTLVKIAAMLEAGDGDRKIARVLGVTRHAVRKVMMERAEKDPGDVLVPLDCIRVGSRVRKDYGDIGSLARSIDANGLLHPVVVREFEAGQQTYELICGERRLRAWRESKYGREPIPVRILDLASIRRGEFAENHERKNFTPSELVEIKRQLEMEFDLKGEAAKRERAGKRVAPGEGGRVTEIIAAYAGRGRRTIEKAEAVVQAAERDPERFGPIKEQMDRTGKVDGPARRVRIIEQTEAIRNAPPALPARAPYGVGVIDFPWPHEIDMTQEEIDAAGRSLRPYAAMAIDAGMVFLREKIAPLFAPDIIVWFWTTNYHMRVAFDLLSALGFSSHSTIGTWRKQRMGRGQVLRDKTEHCIVACRGAPLINLTNQTTDWGDWPQPRINSRKPDEFYRMVEELCPAQRYADIFSFGARGERWDCFGDQAQRLAASVGVSLALQEAAQ